MDQEFSYFNLLPLELRTKIWEAALPGPRIVELYIKGHLLPRIGDKSKNTDLLSSEDGSNPAVVSRVFEQSNIQPQEAEEETDTNNIVFISETDVTYATASSLPTTLLHTCHESRSIAQRYYVLSFGTASSSPRIYFSPELDTLYLPAWSFQDGSSSFLSAITYATPSTAETSSAITSSPTPTSTTITNTTPTNPASVIQNLAFDLDMWFSNWDTAHLNYHIEPFLWPSLKSITFLLSKPDPEDRCCCCMDPIRPAKLGVIGFGNLDGSGVNYEGLSGVGGPVEREAAYVEGCMADCEAALEEMRVDVEAPRGWRKPEVRFAALMRDGVMI